VRVGLVIDDLDPRRGGMSQWCWQFAADVVKRGYELHVISQGFGDRSLLPEVTCHTIPKIKSRCAFAEAAGEISRNLALDVVHDMGLGWHFDIFQPHGGSYAGWVARRLDFYPAWVRYLKRPTDAVMPRHRDFGRHCRRQYAASRKSDTTFVALSKMVADDFVQLHGIRPKQIKIVYNGVDCNRFSPDRRARYRDAVRRHIAVNDETLVLFLAAHNFRLKGVPQLLRVAAQLAANRRPIHLLIAGGKHLEKWKLSAARLGLAKRTTFLGTVNDVTPYYAAADVYVHPTFYDPCSLVLLEAAASGLPIVTTRRCNGAAELFREGVEILTVNEPADLGALYERVDTLFDESVRTTLGAAARKVALQHPFENNVAEIVQLYNAHSRRRVAA
jgi:UDP-glucose:(heptosyl)LPS alpha-1,3-glucosyltransferase